MNRAPRPPATRLAVHVGIALVGTLLFALVSAASGKLEENRGLGWDGIGYALMVTDALAKGMAGEPTRPLIALVARIPYRLGADVITAFTIVNYASAFVLYLVTSLLLARQGVTPRVRAVIVANVALCIATSKMYAFYPVLIDLGALAVTMLAFYLSAIDRHRWAAVACVAASASREFGLATALYGAHRALRQRRLVDALGYLPGLAMLALLRWLMSPGIAQSGGAPPPTLEAAVANLSLWLQPAFSVGFAYFAITLFGGLSALLIVRAGWSIRRLWDEPELLTFLAVVTAAAIAGNADIWRYLVFAMPVAMVLVGQFFGRDEGTSTRRILVAVTVFTVVTQHPFALMDRVRYFVDWFPLYYYLGLRPAVPGLDAIWLPRLAALVLLTAALFFLVRREQALEHR